MKNEIRFKKLGNILILNDEWYELKEVDQKSSSEDLVFKKINKKKMQKLMQTVSEQLAPKIKSKDIIQNALAEMTLRQLKKIELELKKRKPKIKKRHGCLELVVGSEIVSIRN